MKITPESTVEEIIVMCPDCVEVFFKHGIPAISCGTPIWGTLKENAEKYKVKDLNALIKELNGVLEKGTLLKFQK